MNSHCCRYETTNNQLASYFLDFSYQQEFVLNMQEDLTSLMLELNGQVKKSPSAFSQFLWRQHKAESIKQAEDHRAKTEALVFGDMQSVDNMGTTKDVRFNTKVKMEEDRAAKRRERLAALVLAEDEDDSMSEDEIIDLIGAVPKNAILEADEVTKKFQAGQLSLDSKTGRLHKAGVNDVKGFQDAMGAGLAADAVKKRKQYNPTDRTKALAQPRKNYSDATAVTVDPNTKIIKYNTKANRASQRAKTTSPPAVTKGLVSYTGMRPTIVLESQGVIVDTHKKYIDGHDKENHTGKEHVEQVFSTLVDRPGGLVTSTKDPQAWNDGGDEIHMLSHSPGENVSAKSVSAEEAIRLKKLEMQSNKRSDKVLQELHAERLIHDAHTADLDALQEAGTSMKHKLIKGHNVPNLNGKKGDALFDPEGEHLDEMNWSNRLYADHFRKMANFTKVRLERRMEEDEDIRSKHEAHIQRTAAARRRISEGHTKMEDRHEHWEAFREIRRLKDSIEKRKSEVAECTGIPHITATTTFILERTQNPEYKQHLSKPIWDRMDESINKWVTKRWTERDKEFERQEEEREKYCTFKPQIHSGTQKIWEAKVSEIKARNGGEWKETVQDRLLRHAAEGKIRANSEIDHTAKQIWPFRPAVRSTKWQIDACKKAKTTYHVDSYSKHDKKPWSEMSTPDTRGGRQDAEARRIAKEYREKLRAGMDPAAMGPLRPDKTEQKFVHSARNFYSAEVLDKLKYKNMIEYQDAYKNVFDRLYNDYTNDWKTAGGVLQDTSWLEEATKKEKEALMIRDIKRHESKWKEYTPHSEGFYENYAEGNTIKAAAGSGRAGGDAEESGGFDSTAAGAEGAHEQEMHIDDTEKDIAQLHVEAQSFRASAISDTERYAQKTAKQATGAQPRGGPKSRMPRIDEEEPQQPAGLHSSRSTSKSKGRRSPRSSSPGGARKPSSSAASSSRDAQGRTKMTPQEVSRSPGFALNKKSMRENAAEQSADGVLGAKFMYDANNAGRHNIRSPGDHGTYDASFGDGLHKFEGDAGKKKSVAISHSRKYNEEETDAALEAARGQMPERPMTMNMADRREIVTSPSISPGDGFRDSGMHRAKSTGPSRADLEGMQTRMYRQSQPSAYVMPEKKSRRQEEEEHEAEYGDSGRYAGIERNYGGYKDNEFPDDLNQEDYTQHHEDDIKFHDGEHQAADADAELNSSRVPITSEDEIHDLVMAEPLASHVNEPLPSYRLDEEGREIVEIEDSNEMETYLDDEIRRISAEIEDLSAEERSYAFDPKAYM